MRLLKFALLAAVLAVSACTDTWQVAYDPAADAAVSRSWSVRAVQVSVPDSLTTTEEDSFVPNADIVWHGEPRGDRRAQVAAILEDGIKRGTSGLKGGTPVILQVTLTQFHALTPKTVARAPTNSGVHNISYIVQVVDARTGKPLTQPQQIKADLPGLVGEAAWKAEAEGRGQKVQITQHLARVTAGWLGTGPDVRTTFKRTGR